jgi:hypothetical protein
MIKQLKGENTLNKEIDNNKCQSGGGAVYIDTYQEFIEKRNRIRKLKEELNKKFGKK